MLCLQESAVAVSVSLPEQISILWSPPNVISPEQYGTQLEMWIMSARVKELNRYAGTCLDQTCDLPWYYVSRLWKTGSNKECFESSYKKNNPQQSLCWWVLNALSEVIRNNVDSYHTPTTFCPLCGHPCPTRNALRVHRQKHKEQFLTYNLNYLIPGLDLDL